jgi:hypothetical protein
MLQTFYRAVWCLPFLGVVFSFCITCAWLAVVYFVLSDATSLTQITSQTLDKLTRSLSMLREYLWLLNGLSVLGPISGLILGFSFNYWRNSLKQSDMAQQQSQLRSKTQHATLQKALSDDKIKVLEAKIQTLEIALQQTLKS